jgi:membrane protein required for colicin V production
MSPLDIIVLIVLGVFVARGIWIGFIRQLASLIALVLGFVIAGRYYDDSARLISPFIENQQIGFLLTYGVIFIMVFVSTIVIGLGFRKVAQLVLLGWFDKSLGGLFGAAKGMFLACFVFMGLAVFISGSSPLFRDSVFYPYLEHSTIFILSAVKNKDVQQDMLPKQPAISNILANTIDFSKTMGRQAKQKAEDYQLIYKGGIE